MGLLSFLSKAKTFCGAAIVKVFGRDGADALAKAAVEAEKTLLGVIVKDAILAVATLEMTADNGTMRPATSTEKRNAAFDKVASDSRVTAMNVGVSLINLTIELLLQSVVKGNLGTAA